MRNRLRQEEGFALVIALGISVVLVIFVASMIGFTSSSSRHANISRSTLDAKELAESGIATAVSIVNHASNAVSPTLLGCSASGANPANSALPCTDIVVTGVNGTVALHGLYTQGAGNTGTWAIVATGSVRNPTGAANLAHGMKANIPVTGGGQANNISIWNYVYSTAPQGSGCEVDLNGTNVVIDVPLYVTGDLCISGTNAGISESAGGQPVDVRVLGTLTITGNHGTVGSAGHPITSGVVGGGCGSPPHVCGAADKWFAAATDAPLTATPPVPDFTNWYHNASPGPDHDCDLTTPAPVLNSAVFDNDTTQNGTAPSFDLTGAASYNCNTSTGSISWNAATKVLTVNGTIYFDGNVTSSSSAAMYHGKGAVYVNGTFSLVGTNASLRAGCPGSPAAPTHQCAFADVSNEWDPNKDLLMLVASKTGATAVNMSGTNNEFQGAVVCDSTSTMDLSGTNTQIEGPIICGKFKFFTNTKLMPLPTITNVPPGAPLPPNAPATIGTPVITGS